MPFVNTAHRLNPDMSVPGDICYTYYYEMVRKWKKEPRWTTAHGIYGEMSDIIRAAHTNDYIGRRCDQCTAYSLAWQVFFIKYVMPYEDLKEKENGTI